MGVQKLCSFFGFRRTTGKNGELKSLLTKNSYGQQKAEESKSFPYYTYTSDTEVNNSVNKHNPDPLVPLLKYLMFFFNFIFFTLGFSILGFGLWGLLDKQSLIGEKIGNLVTDPMLIFVLVGLIICILTASGCIGFISENTFLLRVFSVGITILIFAQCLIALVVLCFHEQIQDSVKRAMLVSVNRYQDDSDLKFILDEIQLGMECCGVESYQDWSINLYFNCSSPGVHSCGVPYSCCIDPLENGTVPNFQCGFGTLRIGDIMAGSLIYLRGCVPQLVLWLQSKMWHIFAAFLLVIVIELSFVLCAQPVLKSSKL